MQKPRLAAICILKALFTQSAMIVIALTLNGICHAQAASNDEVLNELRAMRQRIDELEKTVKSQAEEIEKLKATPAPVAQAPGDATPTAPAPHPAPPESIETRLSSFKEELLDTILGEHSPLEVSGFFDVTLESPHERDRPFEFGALELDLEYPFNDHYTVSSALVWDGDTSEVGIGVVDYHWFDDSVPARGRIFDEPGLHIQAGRFDLPFGVDYQYFAAPDRPSISAPLTTDRIQQGGYNGDGLRVYGTWKMFDYALYCVDSLYGDNGGVVGGRMGIFPWRDPYRLHRFGSNRTLELGLSYLQDIDKHGDARDRVMGADLTLSYGIFQVVAEWMQRDSDQVLFHWIPDMFDSERGLFRNLGRRDETGFHVTLVTDLEKPLKRPVNLFCRYDGWDPDYNFLLDEDDDTLAHRVRRIERATVGLGYNVTESVCLKIEYQDYLGPRTHEPGFDDSRTTLQLVARF